MKQTKTSEVSVGVHVHEHNKLRYKCQKVKFGCKLNFDHCFKLSL